MTTDRPQPPRSLADRAAVYEPELVALRRDLHAHPELGRAEVRTTQVVAERLARAGLQPWVLPGGSGVVAEVVGDVGDRSGDDQRTVALRADLDALPIADEKDVDYRSTVAGRCHACGHDVHTSVLVGAGLVLADLAREGRLPGRVRLVFQPAEESTPGGALDVLSAGGIDGVERIVALHCDPRTDLGRVGLRVGPITGSADRLFVRLTGPGGHTARPHLTADVIHALATVVTEVPTVLSRRVDPRAGLSLVWGRLTAGGVHNAIPQAGEAEGTVRCLDAAAWERAPEVVDAAVRAVAAPYGVHVHVDYSRGVPPVINDATTVAMLETAALGELGPGSVVEVEQSLGGEDFAWYLDKVPGALARLGVRTPGAADPAWSAAPGGVVHDLHTGTFDVDERAIAVGARLMVATALEALTAPV